MSKYNNYAVELDKAFRAARAEYQNLLDALDAAKAKRDEARAMRGTEGELARARATIAYQEAESALRSAHTWETFNREQERLETALSAEIGLNQRADPDAVDPNALALLNAGFMNVDDFFGLAEKYDNNPTMLRLIAQYARDAADNMSGDNAKDRAALTMLSMQCKDGGGSVMEAWHNLTDVARYCSGQAHGESRNASYVGAMGAHWDELSREAVENF